MDASVALANLGETIDVARVAATDHLDPQKRSELGQVLTPHFVAKLMAGRLSLNRSSIRLLDPGAGIGVYFTHVIHRTDFISNASLAARDDLFSGERQRYDAAILNPPYRKIATGSAERKHLEGKEGCCSSAFQG